MLPTAGWYQDPEGPPGQLKYWDGHRWTTHRAARQDSRTSRPPQPAPTGTWAAVPGSAWAVLAASFWCCGFASFVPPLYGALTEREDARLRRRLFITAGAFGVLTVLGLVLMGSAPEDADGLPTGAAGDLGTAVVMTLWLLGFATAVYLVFRLKAGPEAALPGVAEEVERRRLREEYRQLAQRDPGLALNIGVGRPDLPRQFQDGGLLDLNHIPREHLARCVPISPEAAQRLADARDALGRFQNLDEAAVWAELDVNTLPRLQELAIFL